MILLTVGTRPEWIKIKPVALSLQQSGIPFAFIRVMQHDDAMVGFDKSTFPGIDVRRIYINSLSSHNRLNNVIASVIGTLRAQRGDVVLVQGDTATTFAAALAAHHCGATVVHLEAGLRSFDRENPWPEEIYRRCVTEIADVHLAPTQHAADNIEIAEGVIHVVGNTVLDATRKFVDKTAKRSQYARQILVTLHRRENRPLMMDWIREIARLVPIPIVTGKHE